MQVSFLCRLLLLAMVLGAAACSPFHTAPPVAEVRPAVLLEVPFVPQKERDDCGPAALASLLAYRGHAVPVETLRGEVFSPRLGGTLLPDLENYVQRLGLPARSGRGDLPLLRNVLDAGNPLIIPLELGWGPLTRPHFVVVRGYGASLFHLHAGVRGSVVIGEDDLRKRWEEMNLLYLYIADGEGR